MNLIFKHICKNNVNSRNFNFCMFKFYSNFLDLNFLRIRWTFYVSRLFVEYNYIQHNKMEEITYYHPKLYF